MVNYKKDIQLYLQEPFHKRILNCHLIVNNSTCSLVYFGQNLCCTSHILSNSIHHPTSAIETTKCAFGRIFVHLTQVSTSMYDDMMWHVTKQKIYMKNKLGNHKIISYPYVTSLWCVTGLAPNLLFVSWLLPPFLVLFKLPFLL